LPPEKIPEFDHFEHFREMMAAQSAGIFISAALTAIRAA